MKKRLRNLLDRYVFTDELDFDSSVFNLVCIVGTVALLASAAGHIIERSNPFMMIVKVAMIAGAAALFLICNRFSLHREGRWITAVVYCDVFFPLVFIANGGSNSGIAAYFVLTMVIIVLLSRGPAFFIFMGIHISLIISCYLIERFVDDVVLPINEFQHYADSLISIIVAGAFIGLLIKGISGLFIRARVKADAASKAKSDFLAQMSHEMRTPMNAIIGTASILRATDDIARHKDGMEKIEAASIHLLGVINDILDMSKIEANKLELFDEPFDFRKMVGRAVMVARDAADAKGQRLAVHIDPKLPQRLVGDRQRLAQVITNLLSNAIKFTPDGGEIRLSSRLSGEQGSGACTVRVAVSDTGIGVTEEQMSRLFTSFEQADNSISRRYGGTGLGLSISKRIVELMGGGIWLESVVGRGSTFTFEVPLGRAADIAVPQEPSAAEDLNLSGKSILVVEDIEINREIIKALLEPTNVEIDCAVNGREAVEAFMAKGGGYDLIFMDIQMPEMDGYEAARAIRASAAPNATAVPIIAMTANVFKEDVDRAAAAGMDAHLGKPIVIEEVLKLLAGYLA
jgi:signal transduction histidine kinase